MRRFKWFVRVFVLAGIALLAADPAMSSVISRYSFTSDASDSMSGFDGMLVDNAAVSSGAVQFDGAGDYVALPGASLNVTSMSAVTFETWGTYAADNGSWARVHDFGRTDGEGYGRDYAFLSVQETAGSANSVAAIGTPDWLGGSEERLSGSKLATGNSVHTVVVLDDVNNTMRYYINGVKVDEQTMSKPLTEVSSEHAYLAKSSFNDDAYLKGSVSEFRVYNEALNDSQVSASYARGANQVHTTAALDSAVAVWQMGNAVDANGGQSNFTANGGLSVGNTNNTSVIKAINSDGYAANEGTSPSWGERTPLWEADNPELLISGSLTVFARVRMSAFNGYDDVMRVGENKLCGAGLLRPGNPRRPRPLQRHGRRPGVA